MSTFLRIHDLRLEVQNFNDDFLLLKAGNNTALGPIGRAIFQHNFDFIDEVIVTEVEICLKLNDRFNYAKTGWLAVIIPANRREQKTYRLPIFFSPHEDWTAIASYTGLDKQQVISRLLGGDFSIAMFGFLPGFLYLDGLDPSLQVPRKTVPSKYVEANSVAIGGKYLGLYSLDSPGGWHVVGKIPFSLLDIPRLPPVALNLGDSIRLEAVGEQEYEKISAAGLSLYTYNA